MPFGYWVDQDRALQLIPEQQEAIRRAAALRATGALPGAIRKRCEAEQGVRLSLDAIQRIVRPTEAA